MPVEDEDGACDGVDPARAVRMASHEHVHEILVEGLDDWVLVDRVLGAARELEDSQEHFRRLTIQLIEYLLRNELMSIGDIGETGFESWPGGVDENINRVIRELDELNWNPMGDACWLANTSKGDDVGLRYTG